MITASNQTIKLDALNPACLQIEINSDKKYTYGFRILMRTGGEYPTINTAVAASITVKCMEASAGIDIMGVPGIEPGLPASYLVDSTSVF